MESVFRLCVLRTQTTDQPDDPARPSFSLAQDSEFQRQITSIVGTPNATSKTVEKSRAYTQGPLFIKDAASTPNSNELALFSAALDIISRTWKIPTPLGTSINIRDAIADVAKTSFRQDDIRNIVSLQQASISRLKDTIIVIKRLPSEHTRPIAALTRQLLDIDLLARIAEDEVFPEDDDALDAYRRRPLLLPTALQLDAIREKGVAQAAAVVVKATSIQDALNAQGQALYNQYHAIQGSIKELSGLSRKHFQEPDPPPDVPAFEPAKEFTSAALSHRRLAMLSQLTAINQKQFETSIDLATRGGTDPARLLDSTGALAANNLAQMLLQEHKEIKPQLPQAAWTASQMVEKPLLLKPSTLELLGQGTRDVLKQKDIALLEQPLQESLDTLSLELRSVTGNIHSLYKTPPDIISISRIGSKEILVRQPQLPPWITIGEGQKVAPQVPWWSGPLPISTSLGRIQPTGEADLLIVKQRLRRYEGGDVAHVENILKGELKKRENVVKTVTETYSFLEQESSSSKETGEESTDRFETSKEAESQLKQDEAANASATVSGSYGPTISFSASAGLSTSTSQQAAMKTASKYAKDVTERSTEKIARRILERTSKTITTTISETNVHEINNKPEGLAAGNIAGVYQWVNKVYEARLHNYGTRKMYDFMIPEPAAFLLYQKTLPSAVNQESLLKPPEKFDLNPEAITPSVYETIMRSYGLDPTTAEVYPPSRQLVQHTDKNALAPDTGYINMVNIKIPDGYQASMIKVTMASDLEFGSVKVQFGTNSMTVNPNEHGGTQISAQYLGVKMTGEVPLFYNVYATGGNAQGHTLNWFVLVTITCLATTALTDWQNRMWKKISDSVGALQQAYEAKLAEIRLREDASNLIQIRGTNPASNLLAVREEIKRNCIALITNNSFDNLSAINQVEAQAPGPGGDPVDFANPDLFPTIDRFAADRDGSIVCFFEQAFEWANMTFSLYPYFWARKSTWLSRLSYDDPDPLFNAFLKAGYARVTLPVRPGYAAAVAHYFDFGELWGGGPLPPIGSKDYVSVADEQMEQTGALGKEKAPPSEPWPVLVPTTLMLLRPDDTLPRWKENSEGDWVELVLKDGKWIEPPEETT